MWLLVYLSDSIISAGLVLLTKLKWSSVTGKGRWSSRSRTLTVSCQSLSCVHTLSLHTAIFHSARHLPPCWLCSPGPGSTCHCQTSIYSLQDSIGSEAGLPVRPVKFHYAGDIWWAVWTHTQRRAHVIKCTVYDHLWLFQLLPNKRQTRRSIQEYRGSVQLQVYVSIFSYVKAVRAKANWLIYLQYDLMTRDVFFQRIPPPTS